MALQKTIASLTLVMACVLPMAASAAVSINPTEPGTFNPYIKNVGGSTMENDVGVIAKNIIGVIMGFLGLVAVIIIIMAGFKWMTDGGDEKKSAEAKKQLMNGVIGLVIIVASWSIANFVLSTVLPKALGK